MSKFKGLMLGLMLLAGLTVGVSAQRTNDPKKPPPKPPPPKVEPHPDKPPKENRPKKPGSGYAVVWRDENNFLV